MAEITTLCELEQYWSLDDLMDAHEALDIKFEQESYENNKPKGK